MAAYLGDTDSEDELGPAWEERINTDNRVYFAHHVTQTTQWTHPRTGKRKVVPKELPFGWIRKDNPDGTVVFVETTTGKETKTDPRLAFAREPKDSLYDFKQRFDGSSKALQVVHGVDLSSKTALITGANAGIGFETARTLALHGCEVILACRSKESAEAAITKITDERPQAKCSFVHLDLGSLESVKFCANELKLKYQALDIVILNAGIFGAPFQLSQDNYEQTFQINHLAQFYLTLLLKPLIIARPSSRILILSSESHRQSLLTNKNISEDYLSPKTSKEFIAFLAYNDSKLCNLLTAVELNRRWSIHGVTCNSVHPGNMVSTNLAQNWWVYRLLFAFVRPFTKSLEQAAATSVWGATAEELDGVGGQYLNNTWLCVPSQKAQDKELRNKLWNISVEMVERRMGLLPVIASNTKITDTESEGLDGNGYEGGNNTGSAVQHE